MGCKGSIFAAATLAATSLPPEKAVRLIRYMNCAHAAGYVGLSDVYPSWSYFNTINKPMGLLTAQERARLDHIDMDKGGSCAREVIAWCMNEVQVAEVCRQCFNACLKRCETVVVLTALYGVLERRYNQPDAG